MYNSNSTEIQLANLNAISLWAKVPPYRPDFEINPMALVVSIHFLGDRVNAFRPASFQTPRIRGV